MRAPKQRNRKLRHPRTMLSVDWDFFIYNGAHEKSVDVKHPISGEPDKVPGLMMYDWGHSEQNSQYLDQILWSGRHEHFKKCGLNLESTATIDVRKGCVPPGMFVRIVGERFDMSESITYYSDSHALAHNVALIASLGGPCDLVMFDAHCDLGYLSDEGMLWQIEHGLCDCGSWLFHSMIIGHVRTVTIVYPDWLGDWEWKSMADRVHLRTLRSRLRPIMWSDWVNSWTAQDDPPKVTFVNIARSSAWTPPYLDAHFSEFVNQFGGKPKICMDCDKSFPNIGAHNACKPREYWEEWRKNGQL